MIYRFMLPSVFIWIGLELYKYFALGLAFTPIGNIGLYILSCLMSFLIFVLFDFCVGMIAFFTSYIFGLFMVKEALMSFLTGQLIPLSFFPEAVQRVFDFLPFSSMIYAPVMIYLGKYQGAELALVLVRQFVWVLLLYGLGSLIWKRVTKRLVVLGG
jgi:ABC-2 type transport system permease protein